MMGLEDHLPTDPSNTDTDTNHAQAQNPTSEPSRSVTMSAAQLQALLFDDDEDYDSLPPAIPTIEEMMKAPLKSSTNTNTGSSSNTNNARRNDNAYDNLFGDDMDDDDIGFNGYNDDDNNNNNNNGNKSFTSRQPRPSLNVDPLSRLRAAENEDANNPDGSGNKKRVIRRNPGIKLDANILLAPAGLPRLRVRAQSLRFKGKNHEKEDLNKLMQFYQTWGHSLYPKLQFPSFITKVEKITREKRAKVFLDTVLGEEKQVFVRDGFSNDMNALDLNGDRDRNGNRSGDESGSDDGGLRGGDGNEGNNGRKEQEMDVDDGGDFAIDDLFGGAPTTTTANNTTEPTTTTTTTTAAAPSTTLSAEQLAVIEEKRAQAIARLEERTRLREMAAAEAEAEAAAVAAETDGIVKNEMDMDEEDDVDALEAMAAMNDDDDM